MNLKIIISDAIHFFWSHLVQIAALCLPWLLAATLVEYGIVTLSRDSSEAAPFFMVAWSFNLLIYPIYTGALILLMAKRAQREQPGNKALTAMAMKIWQPLFVVHLIGYGATFLGFMLLVIPGIFIAIRISFAEFYLVLEGAKPLEALQKSFQATRPYFFHLLILMAIVMVPLGLFTLFLSILLQRLDMGPVVNIMMSTLIGFLTLLVNVLKFRAFMSAEQKNPPSNKTAGSILKP